MKFIYWLLALPLTLVAVSFAISNTTPVEFGLWPLPATLTAPIYLAIFAIFLAGCLTGAILSWLGRNRARRQARETRRRLTKQEREILELKAQLARATPAGESDAARPTSVPATRNTRIESRADINVTPGTGIAPGTRASFGAGAGVTPGANPEPGARTGNRAMEQN